MLMVTKTKQYADTACRSVSNELSVVYYLLLSDSHKMADMSSM